MTETDYSRAKLYLKKYLAENNHLKSIIDKYVKVGGEKLQLHDFMIMVSAGQLRNFLFKKVVFNTKAQVPSSENSILLGKELTGIMILYDMIFMICYSSS